MNREKSYRRGYVQGYAEAMRNVQSGKFGRVILNWFLDKNLTEWREGLNWNNRDERPPVVAK